MTKSKRTASIINLAKSHVKVMICIFCKTTTDRRKLSTVTKNKTAQSCRSITFAVVLTLPSRANLFIDTDSVDHKSAGRNRPLSKNKSKYPYKETKSKTESGLSLKSDGRILSPSNSGTLKSDEDSSACQDSKTDKVKLDSSCSKDDSISNLKYTVPI